MRRKSVFIFIFMILVLLISTSFVMAKDNNDIAAVLNGNQITRTELDQYAKIQQLLGQLLQINSDFARLLYSSDSGKKLLNEYRKQELNGLIEQKLLISEAHNRNLTVTQQEKDKLFKQQVSQIKQKNNLTDDKLLAALKKQGINSMDQFKKVFWKNNEDKVLINKLQKQELADIKVKDSEVKNYYEKNKDQFKNPAQIKASHILIKTDKRSDKEAEAKAEEIISKLKGGADFAELAKKYSEGPSAKNGGELGYFSKGQMIPKFESAAFALKVNEISKPVKTQFGYHIIKVEDKKAAGISSFKDVKDQIKSKLLQQKQQKTWSDFVKQLKAKAKIEIKL